MTKATKLPTYHVLNFYHDDAKKSCALTILVNQTRYHIIADVDNLRGPITTTEHESPSAVWQKYSQLLSRLKKAAGAGDDNEHDQHHHHPPQHKASRNQSTDSGVDVHEPSSKGDNSKKSETGEEEEEKKKEVKNPQPQPQLPPTTIQDAEHEMHEWLLAPLATTIGEAALASKKKDVPSQTLEDWYNCETLFFRLDVQSGTLEARALAASPDLHRKMAQLRPRLPTPVPKYIRELDVPWYSARDLQLIHCSEAPPPYHPSMVELPLTSKPDGGGGNGGSSSSNRLFFKAVDNADPQPTKREIRLLYEMAQKGLHDKIKCPQLAGIVVAPPPGPQNDDTPPATVDNNNNNNNNKHGPSIMGFLQTLIPSPTPLTEKFDGDIPQAQRDEWARRAEDMKTVLHDNDIIWGDAKGDNFVVDAAGELWIIDFGGSYTEGWVDQDIVETKEGDDMGVEKVVNALHDPEANVVVAAEEEEEEEKREERKQDGEHDQGDEMASAGEKKRKRSHSPTDEKNGDDDTTTKQKANKRRRQSSTKPLTGGGTEASSATYCYCNGPSAGTMIGCDGPDCEKEWFHLECTHLDALPAEDEPWFCRTCQV